MKNIRTLVVGMVAGAILATAGSAYGATALEKVTALVRPDYSVKVDGEKVSMKNAPLTYNGTTYIPLREAGEILGYDVGFNAGTITLDQPYKGEATLTETTNGTTASAEQPTTAPSTAGDWVSVMELRKIIEKMTLGPYEGHSNTLTLENNGKVVRILEFNNPDNKEKMTYQILDGGTIDAVYEKTNTSLDAAKLRELGIID